VGCKFDLDGQCIQRLQGGRGSPEGGWALVEAQAQGFVTSMKRNSSCVHLWRVKDIYNNDGGQGGARVCEAYEVK
jgi:hypothetical protein